METALSKFCLNFSGRRTDGSGPFLPGLLIGPLEGEFVFEGTSFLDGFNGKPRTPPIGGSPGLKHWL